MNPTKSPPEKGLSPDFRAVDSPWFWIWTFAAFGLIALAAMGPKFDKRQRQLEDDYRNYEQAYGRDKVDLSYGEATDGQPSITRFPLFAALTTVMVVSWAALTRQRIRAKRSQMQIAGAPQNPDKLDRNKRAP